MTAIDEPINTTSAKWAGWYRPDKRHRWQRLAEHEDYGRCLNQLLDRVKRMPGNHELLVSQHDPNSRGRKVQPELFSR